MGKKRSNPNLPGLIVCGLFFLFGLVVFIPLFPPFGIVWCAILGKSMSAIRKQSKKEGDSAAREWQSVPSEPIRHSDEHGHDPIRYSYDACAVEKRLEQLEVLRDAGLLDDGEYKARRQEILALR